MFGLRPRTATILALLLWLSVSCVRFSGLPPTGTRNNAVDTAYREYLSCGTNATGTSVMALLSYSSSDIGSRHGFKTWDGYSQFFYDRLLRVEAEGVIASNYSVRASSHDLDVFRLFVLSWITECKDKKISAAAAQPLFSDDVAELIFLIMNHDYNKNE